MSQPAKIITKGFGRKKLTLSKTSNRPKLNIVAETPSKQARVNGKNKITANKQARQTNTTKQNALALIKQWVMLFPNTFVHSNEEHHPLKIGIHHDLRAYYKNNNIIIGNRAIKIALAVYCGSKEYKQCLVEGGTRINLNGETTGIVSKEQTPEYWRTNNG